MTAEALLRLSILSTVPASLGRWTIFALFTALEKPIRQLQRPKDTKMPSFDLLEVQIADDLWADVKGPVTGNSDRVKALLNRSEAASVGNMQMHGRSFD